MIKIKVENHDVEKLLKVANNPNLHWSDGGLVLQLGDAKVSLLDINLDLKTKVTVMGVAADAVCSIVDGDVEITAELN
jgi:hypothetical protein